ncbi:MAG TPA: TIGR03086 family metal-binding protein [Acidimicrobiales bacterium]|nr:TIGR03086 family metal-binding protein [Acidimicrobiales bacterium]
MTPDLRHELHDGIDGADQLGRVVPCLADLVATVRPADLRASTPCEGWTTRDLLNHVVGGAEMFAGALQGGPVHDISGRLPDVVGDDPAGALGRAVERFGSAAESPGAADRVLPLPWGPMTGRTFLRFAAFDLLVHSWDLAVALDQPFDPPDDLVVEVEGFAHHVLDGWARDGVTFSAPAPPPDDAAPIDRLVAYTGRTVGVPAGR